MALWRPYADDGPVDLSVPPRVLQEEFPPEVNPPRVSPQPEHYYPPQQLVAPQFAPYGGYGVPLVKLSPASSSGYNSVGDLPPESPIEAPCSVVAEDRDFLEFEQTALRKMAENNGGALVGSNPRMRRSVCASTAAPADAAYYHQRERNNLAAKRSRDRRKLREIRLALQVAYLNKKVAALKAALNKKLCVHCDQSCS